MAKPAGRSKRVGTKPGSFTAIETRNASAAALALFKKKFTMGAEIISSGGNTVYWQRHIETWAIFGDTDGKNDESRPWNGFGHVPAAFRQNLVVEINQPRSGIDTNLQSVFAQDAHGKRWVLHQGRMSVRGRRIKEADFIAATALAPVVVKFSNGQERPYHPVACVDAPAREVQAAVDAFVRTCAAVRTNALSPKKLVTALTGARKLETTLNPEVGGSYETAPRGSTIARRRHADVWKALTRSLDRRGVKHSNARVLRYGPDLFTIEKPFVLFEIKSRVEPRDVFEGVGQLAIYEKLLGMPFRKVLLVPVGMGKGLVQPLAALNVDHLTFQRKGKAVTIDETSLSTILRV